jgi:2-polyprenyl-3-methyl-5-hydroxy-6-metoxy-1,4-benzoquinol methylase
VRARGDARIERGVVVDASRPIDAYLTGLDAIYAKEVIEHVVDWQAWLAGIYRALAPGGAVWLSTPNYGEPWLAALEATALELVARRSGFTRKGLHPSRFSRRSLAAGLAAAGFTRIRVRPTLHRLALTAWATRPR